MTVTPYADPDLGCAAYRHPRHRAVVTPGPPPQPSDGQLVRRRRRALGLTQRALADRLGVKPGQVSRWEREVEPVPARYLARLLRTPSDR